MNCGTAIPELTPSLFSFNSPQGACATCKGLGVIFRRSKRHKRSHNGSDAEICPDCGGTRLNRQSRSVRIRDHDISQVVAKPIVTTIDFFNKLQLTEERRTVGQKIVAEIISRLRCMAQLGLDYLSLDRSSVTLSGGELQRVRLATQIGSGLAGVLYVLDEPSIGLHQRDNDRLLRTLEGLRDLGNSVLVVEHDADTIRRADYILDLGPAYRGYFADNCRAFSVDRKPTDAQMKAQQAVLECLAIVERMAKPGAKTCHGAPLIALSPVDNIWPQVAVGGFTPTPRKLRPAVSMIACPTLSVPWTMTGASTFGSTCRRITRPSLAPSARAAST